jgi:chromosome partitioning protein
MIVTVAHNKGGVGKTTVAVHIAALLAERDKTVLLDGDPNRSALAWVARGPGLPFAVEDERKASRVVRQHKHVVIDTEARPNREDLKVLAEGCDLLLIPSFVDALSLQPLGELVSVLRAIGAQNYRIVLNAVPPTGGAADDAVDLLAADDIPVAKTRIRRFAAYVNAANQGLLVQQTRDKKAKDAWKDFRALGAELL